LPDDRSQDQPDSGAPDDRAPAGSAPERPEGGVTDGGYSYSVVDDSSAAPEPAREVDVRAPKSGGLSPWALLALAIVPAIIVGVAAWFIASAVSDDGGGGGGGDRLERNVTNVVNAFSNQGDGSPIIRYEGQLPPAFPDDIPLYPGGRVISSVVQLRGDDAGYIVVFDTDDSRQDVSNYFADALSKDPWQVEIEQVGRESTVQQFSNIEDPDVQGVVLEAESKDDDVTTIFMSIQVVGAAKDNEPEAFDPGESRPLPAGFPADKVPQYPESTLIETGYQRAPNAKQFVVSMVTQDDPADVLQYYRDQFQTNGWTSEDAPAGTSQLEGGEALTFTGDNGDTSGSVEAGQFAEDKNYTRVNVSVSVPD
jgi:hypothetical protein